jgi:hypothetical protein
MAGSNLRPAALAVCFTAHQRGEEHGVVEHTYKLALRRADDRGGVYFWFGDQVKSLLNRRAIAENFQAPGGFGFSGSRQQLSAETEKANPAVPVDAPLPTTPQEPEDTVKSWRAAAALLEYRYLGYFLAPNTQQLLDWLCGLGRGANERELDSMLNGATIDHRNAMIDALAAHHLISRTGDMYTVTDKGREFVQNRAPTLPPNRIQKNPGAWPGSVRHALSPF